VCNVTMLARLELDRRHHGAVCCNNINLIMAIVAVSMNLLISGTTCVGAICADVEIGLWKQCVKPSGSDDWTCEDVADGASLPFAKVDDDGGTPKMETLQGLYVSAVVLLFLSNCCAFGGYTSNAKIACQISGLFSGIASILFLSTAIWVTCRTSVPEPAGWNYTYVYLWIGWLLCNGSAGSSLKAAKDCDQDTPDAPHEPETTGGKV